MRYKNLTKFLSSSASSHSPQHLCLKLPWQFLLLWDATSQALQEELLPCYKKKPKTSSALFFEHVYISTLTLLSKAELTTTERELKAMAAAAIIGFNKPKAATGTPTEL